MTTNGSPPSVSASQVAALLDVTRHLAAPFELPTMLREVTAAACRVLEAERSSVWMLDAARNELVLEVSQDAPPVRVPVGGGLVGACARDRAPVVVPDCYADPRFDPSVDRLSGYRTRCLMSLPLMAVDGGLVGVLQVLNKATGVFDDADVALGEALAAQCAVALARSRMLAQAREAERVARELAVAQLVQTSALPQQPPSLVGYAMHAVFRPAAQTGGDAYDFALIGDRLLLLLADAAGHGVGPALSVMQMQAMLRMGLRLGASLETIYLEVNNRLTEILPDGHFVTAFVGLLDPASHRLRFISGGQSPILHHVAEDDTFSIHKATTFPMGAMPLDTPRTPVEFTLSPGDSLALLSDGIFEAEDASGERFGRGRVEALLRTGAGQPLAETARALIDSVDAHLGGMPQDDDITAVLLRRER